MNGDGSMTVRELQQNGGEQCLLFKRRVPMFLNSRKALWKELQTTSAIGSVVDHLLGLCIQQMIGFHGILRQVTAT